jgi:serine/threonine protein kinase
MNIFNLFFIFYNNELQTEEQGRRRVFFTIYYLYSIMLQKMLCLDPERRITAAAALRHEYFRDIAGH